MSCIINLLFQHIINFNKTIIMRCVNQSDILILQNINGWFYIITIVSQELVTIYRL